MSYLRFKMMIMFNYSPEELKPFIRYKTSRSGGSGGQNVNKVSSKVELLFDLPACTLLTDQEKQHLREKLANRFTSDGFLQIICQEARSQYENKELAQRRLTSLLKRALVQPKTRKATKKSKASIAKRLEEKRKRAMVKINRRTTGLD